MPREPQGAVGVGVATEGVPELVVEAVGALAISALEVSIDVVADVVVIIDGLRLETRFGFAGTSEDDRGGGSNALGCDSGGGVRGTYTSSYMCSSSRKPPPVDGPAQEARGERGCHKSASNSSSSTCTSGAVELRGGSKSGLLAATNLCCGPMRIRPANSCMTAAWAALRGWGRCWCW